ncbi:MAG: YqeG family HAD IIIA-type phosphatase [Erysipelotrichaceae bacterium]|jgi:HAD superfamily phosphatase (TIGR01668 family)|nr:YqeG family HAD IIIA-type phosphatase [Erysipelotrichaceae bacterium]
MNKKLIPDCRLRSVYHLDFEWLTVNKIKYFLVDLDNTLDAYLTKIPSKKATNLKHSLEARGITMIIISNNRGNRVKTYAEALGVRYLAHAKKPGTRHVREFLRQNHIEVATCIYAGDQILSDVLFGNRLGVKTILVEPLTPFDQPITRFNRIYDRILRKKLSKIMLLSEEEKYDE